MTDSPFYEAGVWHRSAVPPKESTMTDPTPTQPTPQRGVAIPSVAKSIVAGGVAVIGVIVPIIGQDDFLTTTDIVQMALGILTAFGVYVVPNTSRKDVV